MSDGTLHSKKINEFLPEELRRRGLDSVPAVPAADWLDAAGLLAYRKARAGVNLRERCRLGRMVGSRQVPDRKKGRWFIDRG